MGRRLSQLRENRHDFDMASNREKKLKLFDNDPHCHWCGRLTILTNDKEIKGHPNPLMATVDHLISRYRPERWVKAQPGECRQVLACFECNNRRATEEAKKLPPGYLSKMGQGFSLNPRGKDKSIFHNTVDTVEEAIAKLKEHGIEVFDFVEPEDFPAADAIKNPLIFDNAALDRLMEIV